MLEFGVRCPVEHDVTNRQLHTCTMALRASNSAARTATKFAGVFEANQGPLPPVWALVAVSFSPIAAEGLQPVPADPLEWGVG